MRRYWIGIIICLAILAAAAVGVYVFRSSQTPDTEVVMEDNDVLSTHGTRSVIPIRGVPCEALVGEWVNVDNPCWHKVYYDDPDEEDGYWGKEWNEQDDVHEEDLVWHKNGWFRWRTSKRQLLEIAQVGMKDTQIPKLYAIVAITDTLLVYANPDCPERRFTFRRQ